MTSAVVLAATFIGAALLLLVFYREEGVRKDLTILTVKENRGENAPGKGGVLTWFSVTTMPVVLPEPNEGNVRNVLVFEQYPLFPVEVIGPWVSPGESVSAWVMKDQDDNPLEIQVTR